MFHHCYSKLLKKHYRTPNWKVTVYLFLRLTIFPVDWLSQIIGKLSKGNVLCLGCGYGAIETILAANNPHLKFIASDLRPERIAAVTTAVTGLPNICFTVKDATKLESDEQYDSILYIDLVHHLADGEQVKLIDKLWIALKDGGTLVMKDVGTTPRWKYHWNYVHDMLMAGKPLTFHPVSFYHDYFVQLGGQVEVLTPAKFHSPYNHYALVVTKPA